MYLVVDKVGCLKSVLLLLPGNRLLSVRRDVNTGNQILGGPDSSALYGSSISPLYTQRKLMPHTNKEVRDHMQGQ